MAGEGGEEERRPIDLLASPQVKKGRNFEFHGWDCYVEAVVFV